jgi:Abortive infection alpha
MSESTEIAKAAAETAKFGTKALDVTEKLMTFLGKVFKEPLDQVSGIVSDRLKFFRWQRQVRMAEEAEKILKSRGTQETRAVPPKLALPLIEAASLEEDDDLQNLWAKLLANAMDPNFKSELRYTYIDILKSLTPLDVKILMEFYGVLKNDKKVEFSKINQYSLKKENFTSGLKISDEDYYISMYNLFRVQCLCPAILTGGISMGSEPVTIYKGAEQVTFTHLGLKLVEATIS